MITNQPRFLNACNYIEPTLLAVGATQETQPREILPVGVSSSIYYIRNGVVKVVETLASGEELIIGLRSRGALFGVPGAAWPDHATRLIACSVVSCIRVPPWAFENLLERQRPLLEHLYVLRMREYEICLSHLRILAMPSGKNRLLTFLQLCRNSNQDACEKVELPLRDWEMAQVLNVTPAHLSRLFASLQRTGVLERSRRLVTLKLRNAGMPLCREARHSRNGEAVLDLRA
jgi:CRP-like cAMP-binding protein